MHGKLRCMSSIPSIDFEPTPPPLLEGHYCHSLRSYSFKPIIPPKIRRTDF
jgi:hypothetical protein